jgi:hypothetical protein
LDCITPGGAGNFQKLAELMDELTEVDVLCIDDLDKLKWTARSLASLPDLFNNCVAAACAGVSLCLGMAVWCSLAGRRRCCTLRWWI